MGKTRRSFTAERKLEIIAYAEQYGNRAAEREFKVSEKNVRDWRRVKSILSVMPKKKRAQRSGTTKWPELERCVKQYVMEKREKKLKVSTIDIRLNAKL